MRTREEQEAINKACIYHPKTKEELQKLVDDPKVDLRKIDTSKITDMSCLISFAQSSRTDFNGIENWDTSHVTDMSGMFYCCDRFNQDISSWDVSSVKDMSHMFWGCKQFNQYIGSWDVGNVKEMQDMFQGCENFDQDLNDWCVREDCIVTGLFAGCYKQSYKNIANAFSKNQISIIGRDLDYMARELEQTKSKTGVLRR